MPSELDEVIGPYECWAHGAGARYTLGPRISASKYVAAVAERQARTSLRERLQGKAYVRLPTLWKDAFDDNELVFCPLLLDLEKSPKPQEASAVHNIWSCLSDQGPAPDFGFRVNAPIPEAALNRLFEADKVEKRYRKQPSTGGLPSAIMAVIDDGIPFAHRNLRDKDNRSRVEFCWLQGVQANADREKQTVLFGAEYTADDINGLIGECGHDEDAVYKTVLTEQRVYPGATINLLATHGAHVLDAAAGHRHGIASASARPVGAGGGDLDALRIIAVQLPASVTLDTTGFGKDAFILSALHYIFDRADLVAQKYNAGARLPLIINFSYGFSGGPHNGGDRLERAIRALISRRGNTKLVMPSGNDFLRALYGEITEHTLKRYGGEDSFEIPWRVQPSDRTSNYLEIWLPKGKGPDGISIEILDPAGVAAYHEKIKLPKPRNRHIGQQSYPIGQFSIEHYRTGEGDEESLWRMVIALAPTEPDDPSAPAARPGIWKVRLQGLGAVIQAGPISCRIQRDNDPFGYARGARQSYFDDHRDEPFEPSGRRARGDNGEGVFVRRFGTINGLATHDAVTVVGGCVAASAQPADYSSAGLAGLKPGDKGSVHYSAPSETSSAMAAILAGGTRSGAVFRMAGTSTAAPQISRQMAVAYLPGPVAETLRNVLEHGRSGRHSKPPSDPLKGIIRKPAGDKKVFPVRLGKGLLLPKA